MSIGWSSEGFWGLLIYGMLVAFSCEYVLDLMNGLDLKVWNIGFIIVGLGWQLSCLAGSAGLLHLIKKMRR
jgi:uncharacterized membrane protein